MVKDNNLPVLNLPRYAFTLKNEGGKTTIYDVLRKKFVRLSPEEWVRQHFVAFLVEQLAYPAGKLGNEIEIKLHGLVRRCDTVVYDNFGNALAIVEYKAPGIPIDQRVFDQIFSYNLKMKVPYLFVSNGLKHFACRILNGQPVFLNELPVYSDLQP